MPENCVLSIPERVIRPSQSPRTARPSERKKIKIGEAHLKDPIHHMNKCKERSIKGTKTPRLGNFFKAYQKHHLQSYSPVFSERLNRMRFSEDASKFTNAQIKELSRQKELQSCFSHNELENFQKIMADPFDCVEATIDINPRASLAFKTSRAPLSPSVKLRKGKKHVFRIKQASPIPKTDT
ncbi:unnamed protein product [Moneuplotes crassus]|uniref:Uncharacterized protein n=1 Tax=Euplotes crassus TaxID=5936 RepID=A0AAD1UJ86_EUPCR|nr:unnamed protein product [Moneuplotes crassus]